MGLSGENSTNSSNHNSFSNYQQGFFTCHQQQQQQLSSSNLGLLQQQLQQVQQQQQYEQPQQTQQSLKQCLKCMKLYASNEFNTQTCSYHIDSFYKLEDRWICCSRSGRDAPPCYSTYHIEDSDTADILNSMTIPKPDLITQNNPIYQNLNFGYIGAEKILFESILKKQGKTLGLWAKRRFRLTSTTLINYYDETDTKVHRVFQLSDITVNYRKMATDSDFRICMVINDGTRNHYLYAPIPHQTEAWINALITQKKILQQMKSNQILQNSTPQYPPLSTSPSYGSMFFGNNNGYMQQQQQPQQQYNNGFNYYLQPPPQYQAQQPSYYSNNNIPIDSSSQYVPQYNIGFNNNFQQQQQQPQPQQSQQEVQWIEHRVTTSDTLAGIAIKYNTSIETLKKINLIKSNQCITHQTLLVPASGINPTTTPPTPPVSEDEKRRKLIQLIAVSESISKEDARSYLANNEWDLHRALKELKSDLDWEYSHPYQSR
ncbi:hypothetical protein CYY_002398 [Polysphondylium violaceum]|uniref:LysM domain-containing protein n=1 Tax=Polysphondylium violaceum TaxID=133409 RepID=A0A8J4PY43_9MYCE|nr:hypothetical protein CYY_002398 [Polysphondylium violaceum]